jgi:hypothetical protein
METVNFLAALWGFSLVIISLAFLLRQKYIALAFSAVENQIAMLWFGILMVVMGVSSILAYNTWESSWRVVIALLGWLTLVKGVSFLFAPEIFSRLYLRAKNSSASFFPFVLVGGVLLGCVLIYFGLAS